MPKMESHESRVTTHHGYDDKAQELHLTFRSGETHAYKVPRTMFDQFVNAPSKGQFFNQNLRQMSFRRVR